nr:reverse transcriptase domain-containing protein [Paenibacillus xylanexedens]
MELQKWKEKNKHRRNYAHFDSKVSLDKVWSYISNPKKIAKHGFYPFIHYTITFHKFNKKKGKVKKNREIYYSGHRDRYIFQYYGFKLNQLYNVKVKLDDIDDVAIAYRNNMDKNNNIHFAKRAIDFIKDQNECYIVIGDFTKFFDSLDHLYLKQMMCELLGVERLPEDYYAVYKNITRYSKWDLKTLLELNGLKNDIKAFNKLEYAIPPKEFKKLVKEYAELNPNDYGIPQGSAISAVLSNIYMLEFDKSINDYVKKNNGLYMRYSDDFIVILPKEDLNEFQKKFQFINSIIINTPNVDLEPDKTQIFEYDKGKLISSNEKVLDNVMNGSNIMNYLGFSFDGNNVALKDKTISKYYYRMYKKLNNIIANGGVTKKGNRVSFQNLYLIYSIKGSEKERGNFISYVKRAEKIFTGEKKIGTVKRRHMQKIRKKINRLR